MTVYPQKYKLNCTKIGNPGYDISMRIDSTALASYTGCYDLNNPCPGSVLVSSTNTVRYTVDITWNGMTVSSGSNSQSTTGDHMHQCVLDNPSGADRIRTLTIKGIMSMNINNYVYLSISTSNCSLSYRGQQDSYHYHCQLDCT